MSRPPQGNCWGMTDDAKASGLSDEERLAQLGYTQVLARRMSAFSNYAVSFTIISVLSGCLTLYLFGMNTGGPAVITWGWVAVGLMTLFVGLAMAEICSAYPTSAGLYFWAHRLAPPRTAAAWAWFTGWFNVLGQVAVTAGIDFGAASFLGAYLNLQFDFEVTPGRTILPLRRDPRPPRPPGTPSASASSASQQHQRLVARRRRRGHRRRADLRPRPTPVGVLRLRRVRQQHRLGQRRLRRPHRPPHGPVHLHRLRRLRPHDRGDARRGPRPARRASSAPSGRPGSPASSSSSASPSPSSLTRCALTSPRGAARPDPARRPRRDRRKLLLLVVIGAQPLRYGVGDGQQPHDLRLPATARCPIPTSGTRSTRAPARWSRRSGWRHRPRWSSACPT